ncbi:hypothetical protein JCM3766R1_004889 [Sporobolomyces carnicolor]
MPRTQWTRLRSKRQNFKTLLDQLLEYADAHAEDRKLWDSIMSFRTDLCQVQTAAWKELWQRRADRSETASTALFGVVRSVLEKLDAGTPTPEDIAEAGVQWPRLVDKALPHPDSLNDSFETFHCHVKLLQHFDNVQAHDDVKKTRKLICQILLQVSAPEWETLKRIKSRWHILTNCAALISDVVLGLVENSMTVKDAHISAAKVINQILNKLCALKQRMDADCLNDTEHAFITIFEEAGLTYTLPETSPLFGTRHARRVTPELHHRSQSHSSSALNATAPPFIPGDHARHPSSPFVPGRRTPPSGLPW